MDPKHINHEKNMGAGTNRTDDKMGRRASMDIRSVRSGLFREASFRKKRQGLFSSIVSTITTTCALFAGWVGVSENVPGAARELSATQRRGRAASLIALISLILLNWTTLKGILKSMQYSNIIAALIAMGGYIYDHNKTVADEKRQANRERIVSQMHKFLVPITNQYQTLLLACAYFINEQMKKFPPSEEEVRNAEDAFERRLLHPLFERPDRFDSVVPVYYTHGMGWDQEQLLRRGRNPSLFSVPHTANTKSELPEFLLKALKECDKPNSRLWRDWEGMVRNELYPAIQKISDIIIEHGDLMEPLPAKLLEARYGQTGTGYGHTWTGAPGGWFYSTWLTYARSWQETLASWDEGDYSKVRATQDHPLGLVVFNIFAQQELSKMEMELVGTSVMKHKAIKEVGRDT